MTAQREWFEKDYYAVLGLSEDASAKEISRAYKKLAKQNHPDTHPDDAAAAERFKEATAAYEVLSHADQRKEYDEVRRMVRAGVAGPGAGRPGFGPGFEGVHFEFDEGDLGDIFGSMFGGLGGQGGRTRTRVGMRGRDVETAVTIDFMSAVEGMTVPVRFSAGRNGPSGEVKVRIPPGIENGKKLRVAGKGERGQQGGPDGDLYVVVHVLPHPLFGRDGSDLTVTVPVTFAEAALGAKVKVPTLNGSVTMRVPAGTQSGKTLRVRGRGLGHPGGDNGDLLVTLHVSVPEKLSDEQKAAVEQLAGVLHENPRDELVDD